MKLVVDTNVLVSGIFWRGAPHRLLGHARAGRITLVASPALLAELAGVLGRARFAGLMHTAGAGIEALMANIQAGMEIVYPAPLAAPVCRDPDDDDVLACAVAARADLIVSGDADLLSLGTYEGISIVSPAAAAKMLEKA